MTVTPKTPAAASAHLLNVGTLAEMLGGSPRHVYRLADRGAVPPPVKLGSLARWQRAAIEDWVAAGCPPCREGGRQ